MPPTDYLSSSTISTDLQIRGVTGRFHLNFLGFGWCLATLTFGKFIQFIVVTVFQE